MSSWRHSLLHININASKTFSLPAHIWRARRKYFCVCANSDSAYLTLKITGGRDWSLPSIFHDALTSRQ